MERLENYTILDELTEEEQGKIVKEFMIDKKLIIEILKALKGVQKKLQELLSK